MDWFARTLLEWFESFGRKDLPWQLNINPYRVWVSEIMLQQTQVTTVIPYFERFMERFPTVDTLANADLDDVLHLWTGLGYYARGRNLHRAASMIVDEHDSHLPNDQAALEALPGIGRSTAAAIRAIAYQEQAAILDGNVKRVLARFHAVDGYPGATAVTRQLWELAERHTPEDLPNHYTQAIMDLGATVCTRSRPACGSCPLAGQCEAFQTGATHRYPVPRPKKDKPIRQARFFVTSLANGATLLEKNPPIGVWGGLWGPPQRAHTTSVDEFVNEIGGDPAKLVRQHVAPSFRHTFTHFHLDIEPVYLHLEAAPAALNDGDSFRWVFPDMENQAMGLSKPAVTLLESLKAPFTE